MTITHRKKNVIGRQNYFLQFDTKLKLLSNLRNLKIEELILLTFNFPVAVLEIVCSQSFYIIL